MAEVKLRIYIAGKITGVPDYKVKFLTAENHLFDYGYEPINPAVISSSLNWYGAMREALRMMLLSDGVALLPCWKKSKGAKIEVKLAKLIGMPIREIAKWERRNGAADEN